MFICICNNHILSCNIAWTRLTGVQWRLASTASMSSVCGAIVTCTAAAVRLVALHVILTVIVIVVVGVTWVPVVIVVVFCNITDIVIQLDLMDSTVHPDQEVNKHPLWRGNYCTRGWTCSKSFFRSYDNILMRCF